MTLSPVSTVVPAGTVKSAVAAFAFVGTLLPRKTPLSHTSTMP